MIASSSVVILLTMSLQTAASGELVDRYNGWERQLRNRVERLHHVPAAAQQIPPCAVVVRFHAAEGRPRGATIAGSSCAPSFERRALKLVRSLGRVGPVPSAGGRDHAVSLKLSYGSLHDRKADRRLSEDLHGEARARSNRNMAIIAQN